MQCASIQSGSTDVCTVWPLGCYAQLGYARLQLLLGYVVPEILEEESFAEDAESRAQETAGTPEESQPALRVPYRPYSASLLRLCPNNCTHDGGCWSFAAVDGARECMQAYSLGRIAPRRFNTIFLTYPRSHICI